METMIKVCQTSLPGVLKIERNLHKDIRGYYAEIYNRKEYFEAGINQEWVEESCAYSKNNVLRGFHGDPKTWKLVCCTYGSFHLVILNYDQNSSYFGRWEAFTLSLENSLQILIPPMHGNAHLTLSDGAVFYYRKSEYYTDGSNQFTVKWNDPRFNIPWPIKNPILSARDADV